VKTEINTDEQIGKIAKLVTPKSEHNEQQEQDREDIFQYPVVHIRRSQIRADPNGCEGNQEDPKPNILAKDGAVF
jgi:hypothetical protein